MDPRPGGGRGAGPRKFFAEVHDELIAFAAHGFELDAPREDGTTLRQHLEASAKTSIEAQLQLDSGPALPAGAEHVWRWFCALHAARGSSGFGPAPIGFVDLDAWQRLTRVRLRPYEVEWILALDQTYLKSVAEASKRK